MVQSIQATATATAKTMTKTTAKANAGILRFAQNDKSSWWWQVLM
jgi:hypothetical protein